MKLEKSKLQQYVTYFLLAALGLVFVTGLTWIAKEGKKKQDVKKGEEIIEITEKLNSSGGQSRGNPDAKVVLYEFSDFQCPACALEKDILAQIMDKYSNDVKLVYKNFPLGIPGHENSPYAAEAAQAAGAQDKFWEMHDILFERRTEWGVLQQGELNDKFAEYAQEAGVTDIDKFKSELQTRTYKSVVDADLKLGNELGLNSTPTILLNGEKIKTSKADIEKAINEALQK